MSGLFKKFSNDAKNLYDVFVKELFAYENPEDAFIPANSWMLYDVKRDALNELFDAGIIQVRNCAGSAYELVVREKRFYERLEQARNMGIQMKEMPEGVGFEYGGMWISNPFYDETMRFEVEPLLYYGIGNMKNFINLFDKAQKTRVAIESTDDYAGPDFHSGLANSDIKNPDGSFGEVVDFYRIVKINEVGRIEKLDVRVFDSEEQAKVAVLSDSHLELVSYDALVHEAGKARLYARSVTDNSLAKKIADAQKQTKGQNPPSPIKEDIERE